MDELLQALLAEKSWRGIGTAHAAVSGALACGLDVCKRYFSDIGDPAELLKRAGETLVYGNADLVVGKSFRGDYGLALPQGVVAPKNTLMVFHPIITTTKRDRDDDILETAGAVVAQRCVLLWQHIATVPIGIRLVTLEHTDSKLQFASALLDLNDLTEDAAKLVEAEALGISHGFKSMRWSRLPGPDGREPGKGEHFGFRVHEFEIMEHSLVSVPSNTDAVITLYSRGNLRSDLAKHWAKTKFDARPVQVAVLPPRQDDKGCQCKHKEEKASVKQFGSRYFVTGSWEWTEAALKCCLREYLKGLKDCCEHYYSEVIGTFADYAIVCVATSHGEKYFRLAWAMGDDGPKWQGEPAEVEVSVTVGDMDSPQGEAATQAWAKRAIAYRPTTASKSATWDASEAVRRLRNWAGVNDKDAPASAWKKYALGFARVTGEGTKLSDFSFPHHDVEDGKLVVNQKALAAAVAAVNGAKGEFESEAERKQVWQHLARHLKEAFDLDAELKEAADDSMPADEASLAILGTKAAQAAQASETSDKPTAKGQATTTHADVIRWALSASEKELKQVESVVGGSLRAIASHRDGEAYRAITGS